jgi:hypothetical protein
MPWPTNGRAWAFRLVLWLALRQNPQKAIPDHRANQRFQPQDNLYILPEIIAFQTTIFPKTTFPYFKSKAQNHRFPRQISAFLHYTKSVFSVSSQNSNLPAYCENRPKSPKVKSSYHQKRYFCNTVYWKKIQLLKSDWRTIDSSDGSAYGRKAGPIKTRVKFPREPALSQIAPNRQKVSKQF